MPERLFNALDGVSLQHLSPVQSRTTDVQMAHKGKFNTTFQTLMLAGTYQGASTGIVHLPFPIGRRRLGTMSTQALSVWRTS